MHSNQQVLDTFTERLMVNIQATIYNAIKSNQCKERILTLLNNIISRLFFCVISWAVDKQWNSQQQAERSKFLTEECGL